MEKLSADDDAYYKDLIEKMFEGKKDDEVIATDEKSLDTFIKKLTKGVEKGYDKKFSDVDYSTPDDGVLKQMEANTYVFSAAKNYKQWKALNDALIDEKGNIRSFNEFKNIAYQILDGNIRHLRAEYDHAVAAAQAARKWNDFPDNALLMYQTVGDERVRDEHEDLNGIVARKDSWFWKIYYIPLGWGCRCNVIEVLNMEETDLSKRSLPDIPKPFQPNVGVYGQIFDLSSDMFKGVPPKVLEKAIYRMPPEHQYKVIYKKAGGLLQIHHVANLQKGKEYESIIELGKEIASDGHRVEILPKVYDALQRSITLPDVGKNQNPEYRIDGEYFDYENAKNF